MTPNMTYQNMMRMLGDRAPVSSITSSSCMRRTVLKLSWMFCASRPLLTSGESRNLMSITVSRLSIMSWYSSRWCPWMVSGTSFEGSRCRIFMPYLSDEIRVTFLDNIG